MGYSLVRLEISQTIKKQCYCFSFRNYKSYRRANISSGFRPHERFYKLQPGSLLLDVSGNSLYSITIVTYYIKLIGKDPTYFTVFSEIVQKQQPQKKVLVFL